MVQIWNLPPKTSLSSQIGQALGGGFAQGTQIGLEQALQLQGKRQRLADIMNLAFPQQNQSPNIQGVSPQSAVQTQQNVPQQNQLSPQQLMALFSEEPELAKFLQASQVGEQKVAQREREQQAKKEADIASKHFDIAKPTLIANAERAEILPQKESALKSMMDAIESRNLGFFTRDNLAELTGIEGLRSPEGAVFKTAGKEFFLGSLKRAGARPNQWIEQQISDMLTKVGRSTEANLSVSEALKTELDVEKKQIELTNQIADQMEKERGYVGRELSSEVMKRLTPYAMERQKELKANLEEIKDRYAPINGNGKLMYDPSGNLRRVPLKDLKEARKAKYRDYE